MSEDIKDEVDIEINNSMQPISAEADAEQPVDSHNGTRLQKVAGVLSGVFSPLLVPTYTYAAALWITPLAALPEKVRFLSSLIIFAMTAAIPMAAIIMLMRMGKVKDFAIYNRAQRKIPYLVAIICYFAAKIYLGMVHAPRWLSMFFLGAAIVVVIAAVVNTKWKISAHATAMGGLCALMLWIGLHGMGVVMMMPWITVSVILAGAVCSSRLLLRRHTPGQVYAGWLLGLIVEFIFMSI